MSTQKFLTTRAVSDTLLVFTGCGWHWEDDAPAFGGSNVWVNSIALAAGVTSIQQGEPFDVFPLADGTPVARMEFAGRKWCECISNPTTNYFLGRCSERRLVVSDLVRRDPGDLNTGGKTCSGYDPNCWDVNGDNCCECEAIPTTNHFREGLLRDRLWFQGIRRRIILPVQTSTGPAMQTRWVSTHTPLRLHTWSGRRCSSAAVT